jgi:hypothetical protein
MTTSRRLYVVNQSTLVSNDDVKLMASACNTQARDHVSPLWNNHAVVRYHDGDMASVQKEAPPSSWVIAIMDTPDDSGDLGWHWQDSQDRIYGEIFAKPCLDAGSTALSGTYAVSSVLSHEVCETLGDPFCNVYVDSNRGFMVAQELCDPVEADTYTVKVRVTKGSLVSSIDVAVSNFVTPEWFDPTTSVGERFDFLGKCAQPFSMTKGGYWVQMPVGVETQKFGRACKWLNDSGFDVREKGELVFSPEMPEWKRDLKQNYGRNAIKRGVVAR